MKKILSVFISLCICFCINAQSKERVALDKIISEVETFNTKEFPADTIASKSPFGSFTEDDINRRFNFYKAAMQKLNDIQSLQLDLNDKIDLELMKYRIEEQINFYQFKEYMNPVLSDNGFHTELPFEASRQYTTVPEYKRYIARLKAFPAYANEQMNWIKKGLALGISQPVIALQGYSSTYNTHIVDSVEASVFYQPFKNKPSAIADQDWQQLITEGKTAIEKNVIPAYRAIKYFFETEYFPKARTTLNVTAFPDGKNYYQALVKHHTTTDLSPDSIFNIGMSEVQRIKTEMEAVIKEVNFPGKFEEFFMFLRSNPKFYAPNAEQLLKEASYIAKKIDGKLPSLFGKLPRQPYGVLPVPDYLAPSYTAGRYAGASIHSKNSGSYWVNTFNLKSRTLYTLEALTLHEAVPGHHLQTALAQELTNLPHFRQNMYVNAFGEGWGLYSEYLGTELGLYKDPYSRFGKLTYEMWRACRLVIDVGIHWKGWSRDQAVQFLASNSALSLHEVNTEINRYITWPGQALAYKMGELKIIELRKKAEAALKSKFDVRAFHDMVLSQGSVTLSILEMMTDDWINKQLNKK